MLYIFGGFPKNNLHAGGLQYAVEEVEELGILEHDPAVQYRKEGKFVGEGEYKEFDSDIEVRFSNTCLLSGIFWQWFPENWSFGNGATVHKTEAIPKFDKVMGDTNLSLDEFLETYGMQPGVRQVKRLRRTASRVEYEARWLDGLCPVDPHVVHLTWLVTDYKLPEFAYERIRALIEKDITIDRSLYSRQKGKHFSTPRIWRVEDGKGALA